MRGYYQIIFWALSFIILTLGFTRSFGNLSESFYFVSFLFPVMVGTSYLVNAFLMPRYLLRQRYFRFALYFIYTLVFSVYLEMLVITLSLVLFANFHYGELNPKTTDIVFLSVVLYFFVFLNTIIFLLKEYFRGQEKQRELETEKQKLERGYIVVRSERRNLKIQYELISYIESVGNYVRFVTSNGETLFTKERISIVLEKLPGQL